MNSHSAAEQQSKMANVSEDTENSRADKLVLLLFLGGVLVTVVPAMLSWLARLLTK
jgi:hypothetical protein